MIVRKPRVAGMFYPGSAKELHRAVQSSLDPGAEQKDAICVVSPHAGYIYSGEVAGAVFSSVRIPQKVILLGPSHQSIMSRFAIMREGAWETPIGAVSIDSDLADLILSQSDLIQDDRQAHHREHSLEVQIPFLQVISPDLSIVPISCSYFTAWEELKSVGQAIARAVKAKEDNILIVASTDMSHQVSKETAKIKDFMAIDKILELDPQGLYAVVQDERISMCGFQATTAALVAAKELGAVKAELIAYRTSGDVTGDFHNVVGYAGLRIVGSETPI